MKTVNPDYYNSTTGDGTGIGYEYDGSSRLVRTVNPSGEKSRIKYDAAGNTIKVIDANNYNETTDDGPGLEYTYNTLNRLVQIKDADGNAIRRLIYDPDGRVIKDIDAKGCISGSDDGTRFGTLYKYNLAGWVTEIRKPVKLDNGNVMYNLTQYLYDKTGKVIKEIKSPEYVTENGLASVSNEISYTYLKNGLTRTVSDSTGALMEYKYDSMGNTIEQKIKLNDNLYNTAGYSYDVLGRLEKQWSEIDASDTDKGGNGIIKAETSYEYDKNGNVKKITSPEGYVTLLEYDEADRLVRKSEETVVDKVSINSVSAEINTSKDMLCNGQEYSYTVTLDAGETVTGLNLQVLYDARFLDLLSVSPITSGIVTSENTTGKVCIQGNSLSLNGKSSIAVLTFKVKNGIDGMGHVTFAQNSSYTNSYGSVKSFSELVGSTFKLYKPDMNGDGKVETDDFTLTAILNGVTSTETDYEGKYDINGDGTINVPDLDFIKDALFAGTYDVPIEKLNTEKFHEKSTGAAYSVQKEIKTRVYSYKYSKAGNLTEETDSNGAKTGYVYDENSNLIKVTGKAGGTTRLFYDENGNVIKRVLPENYNTVADEGPGESYIYDSMNRLVEVRNAMGTVLEKNIYNPSGELIKKIDAAGYAAGVSDSSRYGIEYQYDLAGSLLSITTPGAKEKGKVSEAYTRDALGNVISVIDGEGNATSFERDLWGRVKKVTNAKGSVTSCTYDNAGNITAITDARGNTTKYSYNSMNLVASISDPQGGTVSYRYDLEGRVGSQTDRSGRVTSYGYNRDGSLTFKKASSDLENYYYNLDGSMLAAANNSGIDTFIYNAAGQLSEQSRNGKKVTSYQYNKNGRVSSLTDTSGRVTCYKYDALDRLNEVKTSDGIMALYSFNDDGTLGNVSISPKGKSYTQGIGVAYGYDRDKNITSIKQDMLLSGETNTFSYTYDNNGNRLSETRNGMKTSYEYDSLKQLVKAVYPGGTAESFTYDAVGNRTGKTKGGESTSYEYDSLNRLTTSSVNDIIGMGTHPQEDGVTGVSTRDSLTVWGMSPTTYAYDANGNLISETTGDKVKNYSYDSFNRLTEVTNPDGTWQGNVYDALGMRSAILENGIWTGFGYDGGNVISEQDARGKKTSSYVRGLGLIAQADSKGKFGYYLNNAHGDITGIVDTVGNTLNSYTYDAYGNLIATTEKVANRFTYSGEQFDSVAGQYYLRARYYNQVIGRFMQEDTLRGDIMAPLSMNLYAYVSNNPINMIDPTGHKEKCDAGPVVGPSISYDQYVNEQKSKAISNAFTNGFFNTFFSDIYNSYKDMYVSYFSDPLQFYENTLIGGASNLIYGYNNLTNGLNNGDYYSLSKGTAAIYDQLSGSSYSTYFNDFEEIVNASKRNDIEKLKYMEGQYVGELSEQVVIMLVTYGVAKGLSVKGTPKTKVPSTLTQEEINAANAVDLRMQAQRGIGGKGWRGDKTWNSNVNEVGGGGTIKSVNGAIPTEQEAIDLINASGGKVLRIEAPHEAPNPHSFPHINYETPNGGKGTIQIK